MDLRHLARHGDVNVAQDLERVVEGVDDAFGRFVDDRRLRGRFDAAVHFFSLAFTMWCESEKCEWQRRDAARDQRYDSREWPGNRLDGKFAVAREAYESEPRIRNDRHARVADQRDSRAVRDLVDDGSALVVFVVLVKTLNGCVDAEVGEELSRVTRVFAED